MKRILSIIITLSLFVNLCGCGPSADEIHTLSDEVKALSDEVKALSNEVRTLGEQVSALPAQKWNDFLSSGQWRKYTDSIDGAETPEYALHDLNADGIPELLIQKRYGYDQSDPYYHTWVFAIDDGEIVWATSNLENAEREEGDVSGDDMSGFGSFRYAPGRNAIIGTAGFRSSANLSYTPCYRLRNGQLVHAFALIHDEDDDPPYFYFNAYGEKVAISEAEWETFFNDALPFDWRPLQNTP